MFAASPFRVLLISQSVDQAVRLASILESADHAVVHRRCREPALAALKHEYFDLVVLRACAEGIDGLYTLAHATEATYSPPFIVVGASDSADAAVISMKLGATDYLPDSVCDVRLLASARKAVEQSARLQEMREPVRHASDDINSEMVGMTTAINRVRALVRMAAPSDATVLLTGETGTGKEVAARLIHRLSARANAGFVPVSCAALPEPLLESELFGHRRGSFTGAISDSHGLLEMAKGGTVLLDEVDTLTQAMQAKLLRAVEEKAIQRVGSHEQVAADFRLIAATNTDLSVAVMKGDFRADLFFRLQVFPIEIPPLRMRQSDIPVLATHFCERLAEKAGEPQRSIAPAVMDRLMEYEWPGNVRELKNCIERANILAGGSTRLNIHVPPGGAGVNSRAFDHCVGNGWNLKRIESEYIKAVLEHTAGNRNRAAELLGIDRRTLYRKVRDISQADE